MDRLNVLVSRTLLAFLWLVGGLLGVKFLLRPLLPFLLALGAAALLEPWVQALEARMPLKRGLCAVLAVTALLVLVGGGCGFLLLRLLIEAGRFSDAFSPLFRRLPEAWNGFLDGASAWYAASPAAVRSVLDLASNLLTAHLQGAAERFSSQVMDLAAGSLTALSEGGLFLCVTLAALYCTAVSYPRVTAFLLRQLPEAWRVRCRGIAACFRSTTLRWLRAQGLLLLTAFVILLVGFLWLDVPFALLLAALVTAVDALPVLGAGLILVPWGCGAWLLGSRGLALGLWALWGILSAVRAVAEPRLLAGQGNLPPLAALAAMYGGYRLLGLGGLLLFPFLLLLAKQLQDGGVVRFWR